jgi:MFS family permease
MPVLRHDAGVSRPVPASPGYREVLRDPEYRAVFLADGLSVVGDQITRLAVALLVFDRTGSALLASATYACSYLSWLLGGPVLSALADRLPRRRLMVICDVARGLLVLLLVIPGQPLWVLFAVLVLVGLLAPPSDAARSALLADILTGERYIVGNAMLNAVGQAGQVAGFVVGGALVSLIGTSGALVVDACTFGVSALVLTLAVRERPVAGERTGQHLRHELSAGLALVGRTPQLRRLLAWAGLVAAMTIAPEGLAVTVADELGGGPAAAGVLTASVPAGFLLGCWAVLRMPSSGRQRLFPYLVALSGLSLLASPLLNSVWLMAAVWFLAGVGTSLQLVANSAFVQAVPRHLRGRAFGVAGTLLMAVQGAVLLGAGALADQVGAAASIALVALLGLVVLGLAGLLTRLLPAQPQVLTPAGRGSAG